MASTALRNRSHYKYILKIMFILFLGTPIENDFEPLWLVLIYILKRTFKSHFFLKTLITNEHCLSLTLLFIIDESNNSMQSFGTSLEKCCLLARTRAICCCWHENLHIIIRDYRTPLTWATFYISCTLNFLFLSAWTLASRKRSLGVHIDHFGKYWSKW